MRINCNLLFATLFRHGHFDFHKSLKIRLLMDRHLEPRRISVISMLEINACGSDGDDSIRCVIDTARDAIPQRGST